MQRTRPDGRVTNLAARLDEDADHAHERAGNEAVAADHAHVQPGAALELLDQRVAVRVNERRDDQPNDGANDRRERCHEEADHGSNRSSFGDVDLDGQIVDRLRSGIGPWHAADVDPAEQLRLAARLLRGPRGDCPGMLCLLAPGACDVLSGDLLEDLCWRARQAKDRAAALAELEGRGRS